MMLHNYYLAEGYGGHEQSIYMGKFYAHLGNN